MKHWWRAYDEAVDDPKLQRLPEGLFKTWFNLMCLASRNGGVLPSVEDLAFSLRMSESRVTAALAELEKRVLLDRTPDGKLQPHNWNTRQYKSDNSTDRVKLHRQRQAEQQRNVSCNVSSAVSETPPDTDTDTEQKTEQIPEGVKAFKSIGEVGVNPRGGRRPPRHGATGKGHTWIKADSDEWAAYAADFREAKGFDPTPDDRGGKWFKTTGEGSHA